MNHLREWHVYRKADGCFTGAAVRAETIEEVASNITDEFGLKEGVTDWPSQRVAVENGGGIVDYQPPIPDDDHTWDAETRRVVLKPEIAERRAAQAVAGAEIVTEERKLDRTLREFALSIGRSMKLDPSQQALFDRLSTSDQRITARALETSIRKTEVK